MKKKYYHATPLKNLISILDNGLRTGYDGITYLTENPDEAYRFVAVRCWDDDILVIEAELEESKVEETFDHNPNFWKCKAFGYTETITSDEMTDFLKYERKIKKV